MLFKHCALLNQHNVNLKRLGLAIWLDIVQLIIVKNMAFRVKEPEDSKT